MIFVFAEEKVNSELLRPYQGGGQALVGKFSIVSFPKFKVVNLFWFEVDILASNYHEVDVIFIIQILFYMASSLSIFESS